MQDWNSDKVAEVIASKLRDMQGERPVIGLTGGIGSGKSAASDYLKELGAGIVDSDLIARDVVAPGSGGLEHIVERHGSGILLPDGSLHRAKMRELIFADKEERVWLEGLLHPLIGAETQRRLDAVTGPYGVMVVPLLFETGGQRRCHLSLLVDATKEAQVERVVTRDNNERETVEKIILSQMPREKKHELADIVVDNSGPLARLHWQLDDVHRLLCQPS